MFRTVKNLSSEPLIRLRRRVIMRNESRLDLIFYPNYNVKTKIRRYRSTKRIKYLKWATRILLTLHKTTLNENPRHMKVIAYGCSISRLTRFTTSHCWGSSLRAVNEYILSHNCSVTSPLFLAAPTSTRQRDFMC